MSSPAVSILALFGEIVLLDVMVQRTCHHLAWYGRVRAAIALRDVLFVKQ